MMLSLFDHKKLVLITLFSCFLMSCEPLSDQPTAGPSLGQKEMDVDSSVITQANIYSIFSNQEYIDDPLVSQLLDEQVIQARYLKQLEVSLVGKSFVLQGGQEVVFYQGEAGDLKALVDKHDSEELPVYINTSISNTIQAQDIHLETAKSGYLHSFVRIGEVSMQEENGKEEVDEDMPQKKRARLNVDQNVFSQHRFNLFDLPVEIIHKILVYAGVQGKEVDALRQINRVAYSLMTGYAQPGCWGLNDLPNPAIGGLHMDFKKADRILDCDYFDIDSMSIPSFLFFCSFRKIVNPTPSICSRLRYTQVETLDLTPKMEIINVGEESDDQAQQDIEEPLDLLTLVHELVGSKVKKLILCENNSLQQAKTESEKAKVLKALSDLVHTNVRMLDLDLNFLGNERTVAFVSALQNVPIETLILGSNDLDDEAIIALLKILKGKNTIKTIVLDHNQIKGKSYEAWKEAFQDTSLDTLILSDNELDTNGAINIIKATKGTSLKNLILSNNQIEGNNIDGLVDALKGTGIQTLVLANNPLVPRILLANLEPCQIFSLDLTGDLSYNQLSDILKDKFEKGEEVNYNIRMDTEEFLNLVEPCIAFGRHKVAKILLDRRLANINKINTKHFLNHEITKEKELACIGRCYIGLEAYQKAKELLEESYNNVVDTKHKSIGSYLLKGYLLADLAVVHHGLSNSTKAQELIQQAKVIADQLNKLKIIYVGLYPIWTNSVNENPAVAQQEVIDTRNMPVSPFYDESGKDVGVQKLRDYLISRSNRIIG